MTKEEMLHLMADMSKLVQLSLLIQNGFQIDVPGFGKTTLPPEKVAEITQSFDLLTASINTQVMALPTSAALIAQQETKL